MDVMHETDQLKEDLRQILSEVGIPEPDLDRNGLIVNGDAHVDFGVMRRLSSLINGADSSEHKAWKEACAKRDDVLAKSQARAEAWDDWKDSLVDG